MKKLLLSALCLIFSQVATAGDAGCGLGGLIISKNSKGLQLLATTSNASFLSQPLGITFGTSGCSASGIVSNEKEMQYYVELNQNELIKEMANANGEKLNTLATLAGCASPQGQKAFGTFTQQNLRTIAPVSNTTASEMVHNLKNQMTSSADSLSDCHGS